MKTVMIVDDDQGFASAVDGLVRETASFDDIKKLIRKYLGDP